jgi:hypothetical protein
MIEHELTIRANSLGVKYLIIERRDEVLSSMNTVLVNPTLSFWPRGCRMAISLIPLVQYDRYVQSYNLRWNLLPQALARYTGTTLSANWTEGVLVEDSNLDLVIESLFKIQRGYTRRDFTQKLSRIFTLPAASSENFDAIRTTPLYRNYAISYLHDWIESIPHPGDNLLALSSILELGAENVSVERPYLSKQDFTGLVTFVRENYHGEVDKEALLVLSILGNVDSGDWSHIVEETFNKL